MDLANVVLRPAFRGVLLFCLFLQSQAFAQKLDLFGGPPLPLEILQGQLRYNLDLVSQAQALRKRQLQLIAQARAGVELSEPGNTDPQDAEDLKTIMAILEPASQPFDEFIFPKWQEGIVKLTQLALQRGETLEQFVVRAFQAGDEKILTRFTDAAMNAYMISEYTVSDRTQDAEELRMRIESLYGQRH